MKLLKLKPILFLFILLFIYLQSCEKKDNSAEIATQICSSCHVPPSPDDLPKAIWEENIFPQMAYFMGLNQTDVRHPLKRMRMEEQISVRSVGVYPASPLIDEVHWQKIKNFYLSQSKKKITAQTINSNLPVQTLFTERDYRINDLRESLISMVKIDEAKDNIYIGTAQNQLIRTSSINDLEQEEVFQLESAPVWMNINSNVLQVLEIGQMTPNDLTLGRLTQIEGNNISTISTGLRRPVTFLRSRTNEVDFIIGEYGNLRGRLSQMNKNRELTTIIQQPGAIKLLYADLDNDTIDELIALFGQADESVYVCSQNGDQFSCEQILRFNPLYGSSDMEVGDINSDGLLDIIIAQGDNADYSTVPKNYHGIRIYLNKGNMQFEESDFYPMHGCTNIEVKDFDGDNDLDIIASSFFPVYQDTIASPSIVLLTNHLNAFEKSSFAKMDRGKWLVMSSGDIDNDHDIDIVLGSFTIHPAMTIKERELLKSKSPTNILILENRTSAEN